eukprot:TRINITY_DN32290_c0_g1_i1.p1 TRINITY_DN32290_c0_g1~~TRINITY_DN32290_c0_g1_i1.p1  ORF type:complete len:653 (-),score=86.91 TRINITY_DN32290_c0_g1_i1:40-1998(-)
MTSVITCSNGLAADEHHVAICSFRDLASRRAANSGELVGAVKGSIASTVVKSGDLLREVEGLYADEATPHVGVLQWRLQCAFGITPTRDEVRQAACITPGVHVSEQKRSKSNTRATMSFIVFLDADPPGFRGFMDELDRASTAIPKDVWREAEVCLGAGGWPSSAFDIKHDKYCVAAWLVGSSAALSALNFGKAYSIVQEFVADSSLQVLGRRQGRITPFALSEEAEKLEEERKKARSVQALAVLVRGWRYALPVDAKQQTYISYERFAGQSMLTAIASTWRLQKGKQSLAESEAYWQGEIDSGRVWLTRRAEHKGDEAAACSPVSPKDIVLRGDKVDIYYHKHERVVPAVKPTKLFENSEIVVIDKPAGLSCSTNIHEVNGLRAVAIESLIGCANGTAMGLQLAHRLDQGVTGCLILGKSKPMALKARLALAEGGSRKIYLARVAGKLPRNLQPAASLVPWDGSGCSYDAEMRASTSDRPSLSVEVPLSYNSREGKAFMDWQKGKPCCTVVTWLSTLSDETHLVRCQLTAGLTHQIRFHLASIGLPVANDDLYGGSRAVAQAPSAVGGVPPPSPLFSDDEAGTLCASLGPQSLSFRSWCPKCRWVAATLAGATPPPDVGPMVTEIWLRSWRCIVPSLSVDVSSPLPWWAVV